MNAVAAMPLNTIAPAKSLQSFAIAPKAVVESAANREVRVLVNRLARGANIVEMGRAQAMGYEAFLEEQLYPELIDDSEIEQAIVAALPTLAMSAAELFALVRMQGGTGQIAGQLQASVLLRAVYSRRQLFESMVEFWGDVLNIQQASTPLVVLKPVDDRTVVRTHALGSFRELLGASARSPAMLLYLDNASNGREGINENYARELMELHTLGVDGGYSETDVVEVARALSGWSVNPVTYEFLYRPSWHDDGAKRVLGVDIAAGGGRNDGEAVLDLLSSQTATARHIATRLLRRFVFDQPPANVVDAVAAEFSQSGGDIRRVVRAMFLHPAVRQAPAQKFKRPLELLASSLRVLFAQDANGGFVRMLGRLAEFGHAPFQWPAPNGYPDVTPYWLNTNAMLKRWNTTNDLVGKGVRPAFQIPWDVLLDGTYDIDSLFDRLVLLIDVGPLTTVARARWIKAARILAGGSFLADEQRIPLASSLAAQLLGTEAFQSR